MEEEHSHYHGVDLAEKHISVDKALEGFLSQIKPVGIEKVSVLSSLHRVLSEDVKSRVNVPLRARSTRDGYAVRLAQDHVPAGSNFVVVGDVRIGTKPKIVIKSGEAVRIATGSYVPEGTNAVLMIEYASVNGSSLVSNRDMETGENILDAGEDISINSTVLKKGESIRPQHIALLTQLGIGRIKVFRKPRVAFFSTGDELADPRKSTAKNPTKIYDSNRPFIQSIVSELGAEPLDLGIARDDYATIRRKIVRGIECDALILSAGSSVGERDYVSRAAESIRGVKILFHGVAMRPSSPTGLAIYRGKSPLILLPGFPTSAIVAFLVFARPAILKLSGSKTTSYPFVKAKLLDHYEGKKGITHFVRVKVESGPNGYVASIVKPSEASYSSWMGSANGVAVIREESSPVEAGQEVAIFLISSIN
ncbi:MAG: molybdopterin molybdotransferase MoeA [Nitrososphaerales archaeon]